MAYQTIPGAGLWIPTIHDLGGIGMTASTIDATGEKVAWIGRVLNKDRASKDITKVGFLFGTVTKAGGSAMTVSLQDVDLANGPTFRPDGTQDQTVAIANADAGFATNAWYQTGALSANRTVAHGERLAVVIEYDGGGRLGADTVGLRNLDSSGNAGYLDSGVALFTSSWANQGTLATVILEFTDGTFGTLDTGYPCSAEALLTYNSGSTPDEYCMELTFPFPVKVDGAWVGAFPAATGADFDVILYDGTTPMTGGSVTVDSNATGPAIGTERQTVVTFSQEITLAKNTTYRLAVKPTSANNISLQYFDVNAANHLQAHAGGTAWIINSRTDAGAWGTATTTRRPFAGIRVSACDDAVSAGGLAMPVSGRIVG